MIEVVAEPEVVAKAKPKNANRVHVATVASLFSGMGGFLGGAVNAGFKPLWASDIDAHCCATLKHRFPFTQIVEKPINALSVECDGLEPVDLLLAGFPCQSFSIGGRRRGFDDERGQAVFELFRLLREWGDYRPAILMLENVPNFQSGENGKWFAIIAKEIKRSGYWFRESVNARVINTAKLTGIPQDRNRLFMVACSTKGFGGNRYRFPEQRAKIRSLECFVDRSSKPDVGYMKEDGRFTAMIRNEIRASGRRAAVYQIRRHYARGRSDDMCPTLTANMGVGGHNVPFIQDEWGIRKLTVRECAMLQGFDDPDYLFPEIVSINTKYKMIGNAVTQSVARLLAERALALLNEK